MIPREMTRFEIQNSRSNNHLWNNSFYFSLLNSRISSLESRFSFDPYEKETALRPYGRRKSPRPAKVSTIRLMVINSYSRYRRIVTTIRPDCRPVFS